MNNAEIPAPNVARADADGFYVECPACREFVAVDLVEHEVESGGHHSEPDMARYEAHYRREHA
jgi:hypothetical protein